MKTRFIYSLILTCLFCPSIVCQTSNTSEVDVISYHTIIEPDIKRGFIEGTVSIKFITSSTITNVYFSSGDLEIKQVDGKTIQSYEVIDRQVHIQLIDQDDLEHTVRISYQGTPARGLFFDPELNQAYTAYFTCEWMICNDSPYDRAMFQLDLLIPPDQNSIASGELVEKTEQIDKVLHIWQQDYETPTYTYGFTIGNFNEALKEAEGITFQYYSQSYTSDELIKIFGETANILSFFETKTGIQYNQSTYSQILIGNHFQEMSGFSVLQNSYGQMVLEDSTETNLISHELAHQWWGNMITCKNFKHFWLNEGFATFMSAAYNEYRFGEEKYNSDINSYFDVYQEIKNRGNDKSLVFENWSNPTSDDRNLVYFKGAYILHLLREELGDQAFWNGIKLYSSTYYGASVETINFQSSMEEATGIDLDSFFNEWIY